MWGEGFGGTPLFGIFVEAWDRIAVDYSASTYSVFIDLEANPQSGGYAQADRLNNVSAIVDFLF